MTGLRLLLPGLWNPPQQVGRKLSCLYFSSIVVAWNRLQVLYPLPILKHAINSGLKVQLTLPGRGRDWMMCACGTVWSGCVLIGYTRVEGEVMVNFNGILGRDTCRVRRSSSANSVYKMRSAGGAVGSCYGVMGEVGIREMEGAQEWKLKGWGPMEWLPDGHASRLRLPPVVCPLTHCALCPNCLGLSLSQLLSLFELYPFFYWSRCIWSAWEKPDNNVSGLTIFLLPLDKWS